MAHDTLPPDAINDEERDPMISVRMSRWVDAKMTVTQLTHENTRLREALTALAGGGVRVRRQWFRDHGMPEVADRREAYADALARAALAPPDPPDAGVA